MRRQYFAAIPSLHYEGSIPRKCHNYITSRSFSPTAPLKLQVALPIFFDGPILSKATSDINLLTFKNSSIFGSNPLALGGKSKEGKILIMPIRGKGRGRASHTINPR
ncbi:hypothetical protein E2542_SST20335 [Spatholobus suberectus]|nr:hypothetical protein E2542_SST20335 [Spatholobus suberectus]